MNQTTMSHIFLVRLTTGQNCCDRTDSILRSFGDKGEAEHYMSTMRHQISRNVGLADAVDKIMAATWDKEHISPEHPAHDDENYRKLRDVWLAHREARHAEVSILLTLVGWDRGLSVGPWEQDWDIYIQEIPFGAEVVKSEEQTELAAE